jgi:hypothetical protein
MIYPQISQINADEIRRGACNAPKSGRMHRGAVTFVLAFASRPGRILAGRELAKQPAPATFVFAFSSRTGRILATSEILRKRESVSTNKNLRESVKSVDNPPLGVLGALAVKLLTLAPFWRNADRIVRATGR